MDFEQREEFRRRMNRLQRGVDILLDMEGIKWDDSIGDYVEIEEEEIEEEGFEEQKEAKKQNGTSNSKPKQQEE